MTTEEKEEATEALRLLLKDLEDLHNSINYWMEKLLQEDLE